MHTSTMIHEADDEDEEEAPHVDEEEAPHVEVRQQPPRHAKGRGRICHTGGRLCR